MTIRFLEFMHSFLLTIQMRTFSISFSPILCIFCLKCVGDITFSFHVVVEAVML